MLPDAVTGYKIVPPGYGNSPGARRWAQILQVQPYSNISHFRVYQSSQAKNFGEYDNISFTIGKE